MPDNDKFDAMKTEQLAVAKQEENLPLVSFESFYFYFSTLDASK
jgi:hypothetical protein